MKDNKANGKVLIAVSFGTSDPETRRRTVEAVEKDLADSLSEYRLVRAWTSGMIRSRVKKEEDLDIFSPEEALDAARRGGAEEILIQPTMIVHGKEYDELIKTAASYAGMFASVRLGKPLLSGRDDIAAVAAALEKAYSDVDGDSVLALMAHGSYSGNAAYDRLAERFFADGYRHFMIGTLESGEGISAVLDQLRGKRPRRIVLAPLLLSAGMHALRDMAGDGPDSWKSRLEHEGYIVDCRFTGLGEIKAIRDIFIGHAKSAAAIGAADGDCV